MNWVKYFIIIMFFVGIIGFITLLSLKHQSNIASTQNISFNMSGVNVGEARESLIGYMDRETIEANLLLKIAETQKSHEHETVMSYVFLDDEENITTNDDDVKSVQYKIELLNKKGEVESVSTERIEIHSLLGGGG